MQAMFEAVAAGAGNEDIEGVEVVVRPALTAGAACVLAADSRRRAARGMSTPP
jgi:hypothetical protein